MGNNRFLTEITCFYKKQNSTARCGSQDQEELTKQSRNVLFNKEWYRQEVRSSEKLIRCQAIANVISK
jgi:hypothetical protein